MEWRSVTPLHTGGREIVNIDCGGREGQAESLFILRAIPFGDGGTKEVFPFISLYQLADPSFGCEVLSLFISSNLSSDRLIVAGLQ